MLKLKIANRLIFDQKTIDYELIQSNDLEFILKEPQETFYYDVFMYDENYEVIAAYINLNSNYAKEIIVYKPPKFPKDEIRSYRVDLYQSKTLSGEIVSYHHNYDMRRHIKAYDLKLKQRIQFYIDNDYNPYIENQAKEEYIYAKPKPRNIFKNGDLDDKARLWCRCLLITASKEKLQYLQTKVSAGIDVKKRCTQIYGQAADLKKCNDNYRLSELSTAELIGYINLNNIYISLPYYRSKILRILKDIEEE